MYNNNENGQNSVATSAPLYFDCGLNSSERHIVYDDLTPEKLSTWFKATKFKLPLGIMGQPDLMGFIDKTEDGYFLHIVRRGQSFDESARQLRIGKTITKSRWFAITRFVEDYVSGDLDKYYGKMHLFALA